MSDEMDQNRTIFELINEFINHLSSERSLSINTQSAYRSDLMQFDSFIQRCAIDQVTADSIGNFRLHLEKRGISETSILRKLQALRSFWDFLQREEWATHNPLAHCEFPKIWSKLPHFLSLEQVQRLINAPSSSTFRGARDRAILALLYGCGLRVSEVCQLDICDVEDALVRVWGKGRKQRLVPILQSSLLSVDQYLAHHRDRFVGKEQALFLNPLGKRLSRIAIWRSVKTYAKSAGLDQRAHPHALRHSFATHLMDGGADIRIIQELLGHANIATTDRYTHLGTGKLRADFDRYHPRG